MVEASLLDRQNPYESSRLSSTDGPVILGMPLPLFAAIMFMAVLISYVLVILPVD